MSIFPNVPDELQNMPTVAHLYIDKVKELNQIHFKIVLLKKQAGPIVKQYLNAREDSDIKTLLLTLTRLITEILILEQDYNVKSGVTNSINISIVNNNRHNLKSRLSYMLSALKNIKITTQIPSSDASPTQMDIFITENPLLLEHESQKMAKKYTEHLINYEMFINISFGIDTKPSFDTLSTLNTINRNTTAGVHNRLNNIIISILTFNDESPNKILNSDEKIKFTTLNNEYTTSIKDNFKLHNMLKDDLNRQKTIIIEWITEGLQSPSKNISENDVLKKLTLPNIGFNYIDKSRVKKGEKELQVDDNTRKELEKYQNIYGELINLQNVKEDLEDHLVKRKQHMSTEIDEYIERVNKLINVLNDQLTFYVKQINFLINNIPTMIQNKFNNINLDMTNISDVIKNATIKRDTLIKDFNNIIDQIIIERDNLTKVNITIFNIEETNQTLTNTIEVIDSLEDENIDDLTTLFDITIIKQYQDLLLNLRSSLKNWLNNDVNVNRLSELGKNIFDNTTKSPIVNAKKFKLLFIMIGNEPQFNDKLISLEKLYESLLFTPEQIINVQDRITITTTGSKEAKDSFLDSLNTLSPLYEKFTNIMKTFDRQALSLEIEYNTVVTDLLMSLKPEKPNEFSSTFKSPDLSWIDLLSEYPELAVILEKDVIKGRESFEGLSKENISFINNEEELQAKFKSITLGVIDASPPDDKGSPEWINWLEKANSSGDNSKGVGSLKRSLVVAHLWLNRVFKYSDNWKQSAVEKDQDELQVESRPLINAILDGFIQSEENKEINKTLTNYMSLDSETLDKIKQDLSKLWNLNNPDPSQTTDLIKYGDLKLIDTLITLYTKIIKDFPKEFSTQFKFKPIDTIADTLLRIEPDERYKDKISDENSIKILNKLIRDIHKRQYVHYVEFLELQNAGIFSSSDTIAQSKINYSNFNSNFYMRRKRIEFIYDTLIESTKALFANPNDFSLSGGSASQQRAKYERFEENESEKRHPSEVIRSNLDEWIFIKANNINSQAIRGENTVLHQNNHMDILLLYPLFNQKRFNMIDYDSWNSKKTPDQWGKDTPLTGDAYNKNVDLYIQQWINIIKPLQKALDGEDEKVISSTFSQIITEIIQIMMFIVNIGEIRNLYIHQYNAFINEQMMKDYMILKEYSQRKQVNISIPTLTSVAYNFEHDFVPLQALINGQIADFQLNLENGLFTFLYTQSDDLQNSISLLIYNYATEQNPIINMKKQHDIEILGSIMNPYYDKITSKLEFQSFITSYFSDGQRDTKFIQHTNLLIPLMIPEINPMSRQSSNLDKLYHTTKLWTNYQFLYEVSDFPTKLKKYQLIPRRSDKPTIDNVIFKALKDNPFKFTLSNNSKIPKIIQTVNDDTMEIYNSTQKSLVHFYRFFLIQYTTYMAAYHLLMAPDRNNMDYKDMTNARRNRAQHLWKRVKNELNFSVEWDSSRISTITQNLDEESQTIISLYPGKNGHSYTFTSNPLIDSYMMPNKNKVIEVSGNGDCYLISVLRWLTKTTTPDKRLEEPFIILSPIIRKTIFHYMIPMLLWGNQITSKEMNTPEKDFIDNFTLKRWSNLSNEERGYEKYAFPYIDEHETIAYEMKKSLRNNMNMYFGSAYKRHFGTPITSPTEQNWSEYAQQIYNILWLTGNAGEGELNSLLYPSALMLRPIFKYFTWRHVEMLSYDMDSEKSVSLDLPPDLLEKFDRDYEFWEELRQSINQGIMSNNREIQDIINTHILLYNEGRGHYNIIIHPQADKTPGSGSFKLKDIEMAFKNFHPIISTVDEAVIIIRQQLENPIFIRNLIDLSTMDNLLEYLENIVREGNEHQYKAFSDNYVTYELLQKLLFYLTNKQNDVTLKKPNSAQNLDDYYKDITKIESNYNNFNAFPKDKNLFTQLSKVSTYVAESITLAGLSVSIVTDWKDTFNFYELFLNDTKPESPEEVNFGKIKNNEISLVLRRFVINHWLKKPLEKILKIPLYLTKDIKNYYRINVLGTKQSSENFPLIDWDNIIFGWEQPSNLNPVILSSLELKFNAFMVSFMMHIRKLIVFILNIQTIDRKRQLTSTLLATKSDEFIKELEDLRLEKEGRPKISRPLTIAGIIAEYIKDINESNPFEILLHEGGKQIEPLTVTSSMPLAYNIDQYDDSEETISSDNSDDEDDISSSSYANISVISSFNGWDKNTNQSSSTKEISTNHINDSVNGDDKKKVNNKSGDDDDNNTTWWDW